MKTHTQVPGTPHFMPPETFLNKPRYGKPVDVFSLACIALHVMSHHWPEPKNLMPENSMTAFTETQRRDEYITFCTLPALKELVELCLHNKSEQRPEISVVCAKLKQLKVTVENQVPLATDSNFELFDAVQQAYVQNQQLSAANKRLMEEKWSSLQLKDQEIQERDHQINEKDKQLQEKDRKLQQKNKQIQEKDEQIKEKDQVLQMCEMEIRQMIWELPTSEKPIDVSDLLSLDFGKGDEFDPVLLAQHTNPSSDYDDDNNQLIKDSTHLGYRNPPETKSQIQPRAGPPEYPPVIGGYKASGWPPRTTVPAVTYNRDTEFDKTHFEISNQGQHQRVGPGYTPVNNSSLSGDSDGLAPLAVGTTPQITGSDSSPVRASVPLTESTPKVSQTQVPDSKFGKANLNALKIRLQHIKEVTQIPAPARGPSAQSTSNYANAELSYEEASDNTKLVADLTSLRNKLEKTKEGREAMTGGNACNKVDYNISELPQLIGENRMINNPPDKKPMAAPRKATPSGLAGKTVLSELSTTSPKRSFLLWQCAGCETVNEVHHTSCISCKLPQGKMADRSFYCEFCQLMIFVAWKDTICARCKRVHESII